MTRKTKVLVVEDVPGWIRHYRRSLSEAGFACEFADTRDSAITLLQNHSFDAAIVDLQLRDDITHKGGIDVLEYIAKCDEGTKPFAVSASQIVRDSVQSYKTGVIEFIMKEDLETTDDVIPKIKQALSGYRPQLFGAYDSLTAYLSAPEAPVYWERVVQDTIGCSYPILIRGLGEGLKDFFPILRKKDGSVSIQMHHDMHACSGVFWSKGIGAPIWVSAYGSNGQVIEPTIEKAQKPEFENSYSGFNIKIWRLTSPTRDTFVDFIRDTPWAKQKDKKRGTAPPHI